MLQPGNMDASWASGWLSSLNNFSVKGIAS
jgi:hypothetical protein